MHANKVVESPDVKAAGGAISMGRGRYKRNGDSCTGTIRRLALIPDIVRTGHRVFQPSKPDLTEDRSAGGTIRWVYGTAQYDGGLRSLREVSSRYMASDVNGALESAAYVFTHDETGNPNPTVHATTKLVDASGVGAKTWKFVTPNTTGAVGWQTGLLSDFVQGQGTAVLSHDSFTWVQDAAGNPYIGAKVSTLDEGTVAAKSMKTTQTLDQYGNVTQSAVYDYGYGSSTPATRTYTTSWLHASNATYAANYIRNRMVASTMADNAGHSVTLATNTYDGGSLSALSATAYEFDTAQGSATNHVRGLVTKTVTPNATANYAYDVTGTAVTGTDGSGAGATAATAAAMNFAVPAVVTPMAGTADLSDSRSATQAAGSALASSYGYNTALSLTSTALPNSATSTQTFDPVTALLLTSKSVHGANYTYAFGPTVVTAATGTHWTKVYKDGFGRDLAVETGYGWTVVSHVDNVYGLHGRL